MMKLPETGEWFNGYSDEIAAELTRVSDVLYDYNNMRRSMTKIGRASCRERVSSPV